MNLTELSDESLEASLLGLRGDERRILIEVLHHLNEVERRRLHLARACPSMFVYCTRVLGYSESAAGRRIAAARAMRQAPRIEGMLASGEANLSTVSMAAPEVRRDESVLDEVRGKSQRQVEALLAARREPERVRDRIRPVKRDTEAPAYEFRFAASPQFHEKFERARTLMSGRHPRGATHEQVLEAALDAYIEANDPARRVRETSRATPAAGVRTRVIPAAVRRAVWRRDGGICTFRAADGARCGSNWDVEVHHQKPYCRGGPHTEANLRLLCAAHNRNEWMRQVPLRQ